MYHKNLILYTYSCGCGILSPWIIKHYVRITFTERTIVQLIPSTYSFAGTISIQQLSRSIKRFYRKCLRIEKRRRMEATLLLLFQYVSKWRRRRRSHHAGTECVLRFFLSLYAGAERGREKESGAFSPQQLFWKEETKKLLLGAQKRCSAHGCNVLELGRK